MSLLDQGFGRATADSGWRGRPQELRGGEQGEEDQPSRVNVGDAERMVSIAAGAIVALAGVSRRSVPGLVLAGVGGALIYRGATGHCHAYDALGIGTAAEEDDRGEPTEAQIRRRGIHVAQAFLINRSPQDLYGYWRNFENLPRIMHHLEEVRVLDDRRSHWAARLPRIAGGKRLEWDAEITRDEPNALIAWRSLGGSDIDTAGEVRFEPAMGDRGTTVRAVMNYVPPGGILTSLLSPLFSKASFRLVREDMRNFKRMMEVGDVLTIIGQPHGTCTGQGELYTEKPW